MGHRPRFRTLLAAHWAGHHQSPTTTKRPLLSTSVRYLARLFSSIRTTQISWSSIRRPNSCKTYTMISDRMFKRWKSFSQTNWKQSRTKMSCSRRERSKAVRRPIDSFVQSTKRECMISSAIWSLSCVHRINPRSLAWCRVVARCLGSETKTQWAISTLTNWTRKPKKFWEWGISWWTTTSRRTRRSSWGNSRLWLKMFEATSKSIQMATLRARPWTSSYLVDLRIYREKEAPSCGSWRWSSQPSWTPSRWRRSMNIEGYSRASMGSIAEMPHLSTRCSHQTKGKTNQSSKDQTNSLATSSSLSLTSSWTIWIKSKEMVVQLISILSYKLAWSSFSDRIKTYRMLIVQQLGICQGLPSCRLSREMSIRKFWATTWSESRKRSSRAFARWSLRSW